MIPLLKFSTDVRQAEISPELHLTEFTRAEKEALWRDYQNILNVIGFPVLTEITWKLIGTYEQRPGKPDDQATALNEARLFLGALRLHQAGDVGVSATFHGTVADGSDPDIAYVSYDDRVLLREYGPIYSLPGDQLPSVLSLADILRRLQSRSDFAKLGFALRRFDLAYSRDRLEDRLIDLAIALDSSLLAGDRGLGAYTLALRGAALLAHHKNPRQTRSLLRAMYHIRNLIVHGGMRLDDPDVVKTWQQVSSSPGTDGSAIRGVIEECEDVVRAVLRAFLPELDRGQFVAAVNNALEERIVSGLT